MSPSVEGVWRRVESPPDATSHGKIATSVTVYFDYWQATLDACETPEDVAGEMTRILETEAEAKWQAAEVLAFDCDGARSYTWRALVHPAFSVPPRAGIALCNIVPLYPAQLTSNGETVPFDPTIHAWP